MPVLSGLAFQPIAFGVPEGDSKNAKAVNTGLLVWTGGVSSYTLDPTQSNQLLEMQSIQSVFVDNYNTGTLLISVSGSMQVLRVPPKSQAYLPIIAGDRPVLTFTNVGNNGYSQAWLLNVPAGPSVWAIP